MNYSKIFLAVKSPGNWAIVLATAIGYVQQVRPCLTGKAGAVADAGLAIVASGGIIWNTLHLQKNLDTPAP